MNVAVCIQKRSTFALNSGLLSIHPITTTTHIPKAEPGFFVLKVLITF